jgi:hypothetical protein
MSDCDYDCLAPIPDYAEAAMYAVTFICAWLAYASVGHAEWLWVAPLLNDQTPIPSFTTYGIRHSSPSLAHLSHANQDRLRITDARVKAISKSHVALVSSETGDLLLLPLKKAAAALQVRSRAGSALNDAIALRGEAPADTFSDNAWLIENGARTMNFSSPKNRTVQTSASMSPPVSPNSERQLQLSRTQSQTIQGHHDSVAQMNRFANESQERARRTHVEAITQLQRFSYDSQKQASRMNQDASTQHNRIMTDAQHGSDPLRELNRFSNDSLKEMQRQNADRHLEGIRSMNDAMRGSGMAPSFPEPVFHNPVFP